MIGPRSVYYEKVKEFESDLITEALTKSRGNQAQAARMLGLPLRSHPNFGGWGFRCEISNGVSL